MSVFETLPPDAQSWLVAHGMEVGRLAQRGDRQARLLLWTYDRAAATDSVDSLRDLLGAIRKMREKLEKTIDKPEKSGT